MRSFHELALRLVPGRWVNIRRKVRKGLEQTYQMGVEDAARVVEAHAAEVAERIRQLGVEGTQPSISFEKRPPTSGPQSLQ